MVAESGMSYKLGPVSFGQKNEQIFLGREISQHKDYSEATAQVIDEEVDRIIKFCVTEARQKLSDSRQLFETLARNLIERETLDADEIKLIIAGQDLPPLANNKTANEFVSDEETVPEAN